MTNIDYKTDNTQDKATVFSKSLETPTTSSVLSENCHTKRRVLMFENNHDDDYQMLQEYASTAVSSFTKQNESDDELLPVNYTQILPHTSCGEKNTKSPGKNK